MGESSTESESLAPSSYVFTNSCWWLCTNCRMDVKPDGRMTNGQWKNSLNWGGSNIFKFKGPLWVLLVVYKDAQANLIIRKRNIPFFRIVIIAIYMPGGQLDEAEVVLCNSLFVNKRLNKNKTMWGKIGERKLYSMLHNGVLNSRWAVNDLFLH